MQRYNTKYKKKNLYLLFPNCFISLVIIPIILIHYIFIAAANDITTVMEEEVYKKNRKCKSYIVNYYEIFKKGGKVRKYNGKIIYKDKDKIIRKEINQDGEQTIIILNEGAYWTKGIGNVPRDTICKINFKALTKKFGYLTNLILPFDLKDSFQKVKPNSLKYVRMRYITINNLKEKFVYEFKGKYLFLDMQNEKIQDYNATIFVDGNSGFLWKLLLFDENDNLIFERIIKKIKVNPRIDDIQFEYKLKENEKLIDSTKYFRSLFTKLSTSKD